ncbi:MAG: DNA polymerase III subunit gamma/tau [Bacteroidetes bacterium]|nr:DNA polymerase III subunit gamma/tau [Bacteroidota bacterium]
MSFLVTARKYRPATFQEVVAQGHVVNTLLNAIRLERVAHAYLFAGPRGVGKTTTARIFAKALNCPDAKDGEPCNVCDSCQEIAQGRCIDIIEIDGASNNGVEQVRTIRDSVRYMPSREKYKMYIIDEVHMLSKGAFNALLKTLEEPPAHAIFIFATTEAHRLPPTVLSRCQRYDFRRIAIEDIVSQLKHICEQEGIFAEEEALFTIARKGDGSMRDSESIFDQVVAFSGDQLTYDATRQVLHVVDQDTFFQLTDLIITKDSSGGFNLADNIVMSGYDIQDFLAGLEEHYRNLLVARTTGDTRLIEAPEDTRDRYSQVAERFSEGDLLRLLKITAQTMQAVKYSPQPRLKFEVALIDMIRMDSTIEISTLLSNMGSVPEMRPQRAKPTPTQPASSTASRRTESRAAAGPGIPASKAKPVSPAPSGIGTSVPAQSMERKQPSVGKQQGLTAPATHETGTPSDGTPQMKGVTGAASREEPRMRFAPASELDSTDADATEPVRDAEHRFRQALSAASISSVASYTDAPAPSQDKAPPPIVQLLIDELGAVILPKEH